MSFSLPSGRLAYVFAIALGLGCRCHGEGDWEDGGTPVNGKSAKESVLTDRLLWQYGAAELEDYVVFEQERLQLEASTATVILFRGHALPHGRNRFVRIKLHPADDTALAQIRSAPPVASWSWSAPPDGSPSRLSLWRGRFTAATARLGAVEVAALRELIGELGRGKELSDLSSSGIRDGYFCEMAVLQGDVMHSGECNLVAIGEADKATELTARLALFLSEIQ